MTAHSAGASTLVDTSDAGPIQAAPQARQSTLQPSKSALSFGQLFFRGVSVRTGTVDVTNTGATPLSVGGYVKTGPDPNDFAVSTSACGTLQHNQSCQVVVAFTPKAAGPRTAVPQLLDSTGVKTAAIDMGGSITRHGPTVRAAIRRGLAVSARRLQARR
jgi:hypothetical protein